MKRLRGIFLLGSFFLLPWQMAAADDFSDYLNQAKQLSGQGTAALQQVDPTTIPNYTDNPDTSQYYTGVTQTTDDMAAPAKAAEESTPATAAVADDFATRGRFEINHQSYSISNSNYIQQHANAITTGDTSTGVVCTNANGQSVPTKNATCVRSQSLALSCHDRDVVTVFHPQAPVSCQHIVVQMNNSTPPPHSKQVDVFHNDRDVPAVYVFLVDGPDSDGACYVQGSYLPGAGDHAAAATIRMGKGLTYTLWLQGLSPNKDSHGNPIGGATIQFQSSGQMLASAHVEGQAIVKRDIQQDATDDRVGTTKLFNTAPFYVNVYGLSTAWLTTPQSPPPVIIEQWVSDCDSQTALIHSDSCMMTGTGCTDGPSTKTIDGVPITEACWARTTSYHCGQPDDGSCDGLLVQGCSQQSSTCLIPGPGMCLAYQETFVCLSVP